MIVVKRFFDPKLAQVSYLIGSSDTGQAVGGKMAQVVRD